MFEYICGKLVAVHPHKAVIDVGGIGYAILIALNTYARLPKIGQEIVLYLFSVIREEAHLLYGFLTQGERDLCEKFTLVSGIGPKTALALIGHLEITDLQTAIVQGNVALLSKIPGIGKKTAERIVLELRDKLTKDNLSPLSLLDPGGSKGVISDAVRALVNLGYPPIQAQKAVQKSLGEETKEPELSRLITLALRCI